MSHGTETAGISCSAFSMWHALLTRARVSFCIALTRYFVGNHSGDNHCAMTFDNAIKIEGAASPPPASPASHRRPPPTPPILFHSTDRPDPAQASTPGWSPCSVLAARLPPSPAGQSAHSPARPAAMGSSGPGCSRINVGCAPATGRAARPRPSRLSSPGRPARLRPWPRGRLASAPPTG